MIDLLSLHKQFILTHLRPGDTAADFTMGNGYDTEFLSKAVGEEGHVYAFDIQPQALECTAHHLEATGCPQNCTLILDSHSNAREHIKGSIRAGMFNLGWLPGSDKTVTTRRETTLPAIEAAIDMLSPDGVLTVAVYPGHAEGEAEGELIENYLSTLSRHRVCVTKIKIVNSPTSPFFFLIETKEERPHREGK